MRRTPLTFVILLALLAWPMAAGAHQETGSATGFLSGLHHPVSGWDHILAMVAVGLWGAQLGAPAVWALPVAFPMVMALGGALGLMGIALPGVEIGIAFSAMVLGTMVLGKVRPPLWVAGAIVGFFAIFHGHAHGTELPPNASAIMYSIGFVVGTGLLHAVGITIGLVQRWKPGDFVLRAAGFVVTAGGVYFLWAALR
ncbi:MAG TPA: HupE/UreJ family protein [Candidatus Krumholzibacteria bacterium]|nr:HupE/UreJ family protein [Candidatus Krumholzibacteria bacterium]